MTTTSGAHTAVGAAPPHQPHAALPAGLGAADRRGPDDRGRPDRHRRSPRRSTSSRPSARVEDQLVDRRPADDRRLDRHHRRARRLPPRRLRRRHRRVPPGAQRQPARRRASPASACYLARFDLSRGFFLLAYGLGVPALLLGRIPAAPRAARRATPRPAAPPRAHRRLPRPRRRDRPRAGARALAGLRGDRRADPGVRPQRGDGHRRARRRQRQRGHRRWPRPTGRTRSSSPAARSARRRSSGETVWDLEQESIQVVIAPSVTDISNERIKIRPVGGLPLMHIEPPTWSDASRWGKRTFDLVGSLSLILAFAPLFLLRGRSQVKLHDRGPVLFRQTRIGKDGKQFGCFKFRTMVVDAEARLAAPARGSRARRGPLQDEGRPAHHRARVGGCGASRSTSCPSCSTWCAAR